MNKSFLVIVLLVTLISCSKTDDDLNGNGGGGGGGSTPATITIVNVIPGGADAQLEGVSSTIPYEGTATVTVASGASLLHIYPAGDPTHTYFNSTIATVAGARYSLYLAGQLNNIKPLVLSDSVTKHTDSTGGIRFVVLAPDVQGVSVNVAGNPSGSVFHDYAFGQNSQFLNFPTDGNHQHYTFEFRNSETDSLLLSYSLASPLFHNVSVVFGGLAADHTLNAFTISND